MTIKLQSIFSPLPGKECYTYQELFFLELEANFLREMTERLNLAFRKNNSLASNVCFANSADVRLELRTDFTRKDIVHYVSAFITKDGYELDLDEVPFPASTTVFWKGVVNGRFLVTNGIS